MFTDKTILFIIASYLVGSIPGPSVWFTITSSLRRGAGPTFFTVLGQVAGNVIFITLLLLGLATFVSDNYAAFSLIKYLGAAYLFYIAVRMFITESELEKTKGGEDNKSNWKLFGEGLMVCLSNPKLFLYYAAFLPQFVIRGQDEFPQLILLSLLTIPIGFSILIFYTFGADFVRKKIFGLKAERYLNKVSAVLIFGVAVLILVYN